MEKYSKWRDSGTGIQPFLQPVPARTQQLGLWSAINAVKSYILGPLVAVVRFAALGATAVLASATTAIGALLVVPSIRRGWTRCTQSVLARLALFIVGFYSIDAKTISLQKGRRTSAKQGKNGAVKSGDIIIANHASYIDILYLVAKYSPVFIEIDNASTYARPISVWAALTSAARQTPALLPAKEARPLREITETARLNCLGPVVVFPENATSNGRALLQFLPMFEDAANLDEKSDLHILAFKYPFQSFSPAYSVGSQLGHLFGVCCQVYNSLVVRILEQDETPSFRDSAVFCDAGNVPVDLDEAVKEKLLQLSRLRMTKLTAMDKRDFLAFYYKRTKKGYTQPSI
ncbi:Lysophosphatidic acid:oleoyl-CoA acyltransferase 1 [Coemansia spiralis]|uniref:Lysophosphatidic acid:oleoyl-CoA acyltransferase 1 n=1 Tax=Coemansia spiralis TaxID=417178 RepID=A0A9W8GGM5_9FUNG|nr:Lysophosphatidic acid:oleoyl-CoA acyltransferase 1 [Coemansia spiralis]